MLFVAEADGALDKARKHKKRQLQDTLNLVVKKRRVIAYYVFLYCFCWTTLLYYLIMLCRLPYTCVLCTVMCWMKKEDKTYLVSGFLKSISKLFLWMWLTFFHTLIIVEKISCQISFPSLNKLRKTWWVQIVKVS